MEFSLRVVLCVAVVLFTALITSQGQCVIPTEQDVERVAESVLVALSSEGGILTVNLMQKHFTCLATASQNMYTSASVVIRFTTNLNPNSQVQQFQLICDNDMWARSAISTFDNNLPPMPFDIETKFGCYLCEDDYNTPANYDSVTNCFACDPACNNTGEGFFCTGSTAADCVCSILCDPGFAVNTTNCSCVLTDGCEAAGQPCANGGTCMSDLSASPPYFCVCTSGFSAPNCMEIENHEVLLFEDQYALVCGNSTAMDVEWSYHQQEGDTPVPITVLADTSYIVSENILLITNIKADHEGYYSCNQVETLYHLIVYAVPRFIDCLNAPTSMPCTADEVNNVTEGDNITFNVSVVYIPGGPSGMEQIIRLVRLETSSTLVSCLQVNLNTCIINPMNPIYERVTYSRNGSNPWFDIEINVTSAELSDSSVYTMLLEAQDLINTDVVMRRTSVVTVSVTPSPTIVTPTSVASSFPSNSLGLSTVTGVVIETSGTKFMCTALLGEPSNFPTISPEAANSSNISAAGFVSVLVALLLLLLM